MSYELAKAVGHQYPDQPVSWTRKDLIAYAVGIGAKKDDLAFVYELDKKFAAFPTYPVVLGLKGDSTDVTDFCKMIGGDPIPGLPTFDPNRVVHGFQSIEIFKPLPVESGNGWTQKKRIIGVHENKSGIIIENELKLTDPKGVVYARMVSSTFNVGAKAIGKFSKSIAKAPAAKPIPEGKKADYVLQETVSEEQALVYRLSGDYNPLHIDPSIGKKAGFGGVILHGLSTYGFAARAVLKVVGGNDATALKAFGARFTSPVRPGDTIQTSIWKVASHPDGVLEIAFNTKNITSGKMCLGGGFAYVALAKAKL